MISNWTNFKQPFARLDEFTRHEPFPSEETKATYVDEMNRPRRNRARTALKRRWKKQKDTAI